MAKSAVQSTDDEIPGYLRVLAAGGWLLFAIGAFVSDVARHRRAMDDRHPIDVRCDVAERAVTPAESPALSAPVSTTSPMNEQREKRRQELKFESELAYGQSPPHGLFGEIIRVVPCWFLFGVCSLLMLPGSTSRIVGCALGGWTFWAWAAQVAMFAPLRSM